MSKKGAQLMAWGILIGGAVSAYLLLVGSKVWFLAITIGLTIGLTLGSAYDEKEKGEKNGRKKE